MSQWGNPEISPSTLNISILKVPIFDAPAAKGHKELGLAGSIFVTMDRESLVYKAKLAEQAERFDEMVSDMKEVARQPQELTVEERNLLSVAYKNVIGSRRASWRVVTSIEQKGDPDKMTIIKDYKAKIETELVEICNDILSIIEDSLIPNSTSEEAKGELHFGCRCRVVQLCCVIVCVCVWMAGLNGGL